MNPNPRTWGQVLFLYIYGSTAHLLFLRTYAVLNYEPGDSRNFVDHPLTSLTMAVLGGGFVAWILSGLTRRLREERTTAGYVVESAGRAIGATTLTLEVFYILASIFLASLYQGSGMDFFEGFFGFFLGIQTYGIIGIFIAIPFAITYGILGGALLRFLWPKRGERLATSHFM